MPRIAVFCLAALLATAVAVVAWWPLSLPVVAGAVPFGVSVRHDVLPFLAAVLVLVVAVVLLRRSKGLARIILLVGAVPLFVVRLHDLLISLAVDLDLIPYGYSFLFPTCTENPAIERPVFYLRLLSILTFIGLFGCVLQATRTHLTNRSSRRLPAVRSRF